MSDSIVHSNSASLEAIHEQLNSTNERMADVVVDLSATLQDVSSSRANDLSSADAHSIVTSIEQLALVAGSVPDGSYYVAMVSGGIGAIIASFTAFLFNFLYLKNIHTRNKKAHYCRVSISHLEHFEEIILKYWLSGKDDENRDEMVYLETRIKSSFQVLNASMVRFSSLLKAPDADKKIIDDFLSDIFDIATGGEFEAISRETNKATAADVSTKCSKVHSKLIKYSHKAS